jgi:phage pi2 protein 07
MADGAEVTFKGTMKENEKDGWLESGLRKQLLQAAVQHIIKELTPDRLEAWAIKLIDDAFKGIHFYDIKKEIEAQALPDAKQLLTAPEMQERIRKTVEDAVEATLIGLPEEVKRLISSRVSDALRSNR